jgi:acetoin utilization deacetylase AcuC-like enzyme
MADSLSLIFSPTHRQHDPDGHPEVPARVEELRQAALDFGAPEQGPGDFGMEPIAAVHSPELLALLQTAYRRFAQLKEGPRPATPDTFAVGQSGGHAASRTSRRVSRNIWAQLGHHCTDNLTPILPHTWDAAYAAAQVALTAAQALDRAPLVYALTRPPGHHAYRDLYGGYCYLNNAAIAAQWLAKRGRRPAILDLDYHHGNGTQAIFYDRADVFFCSLHADPADEYPYYAGYPDEMGEGEGEGATLNVALPADSDDAAYRRALDWALAAVDAAAPDVLIVSLGFDTLAGDPHGGLRLTPAVFRPIGRSLAELGRPILLVQEGGYQLGTLRPALLALLDGLTTAS